MRNFPNLRLDKYRIAHPYLGKTPSGYLCGAFQIGPLTVMSSGSPSPGDVGYPWEHVSVSTPTRCPTWDEMKHVKELFWADDETVVQFHPEKSQYVNKHP